MTNPTAFPETDHPGRQAAVDWLLGRINYERTAVIPYDQRQLKLDRMRQLLVRLGQPDAALQIVHVAGTKGKGSTSAMIGAMLTAAGFRTGVYSSPHVERIEERFAVDGRPCTAKELVALVERLRPVVKSMDDEAAAAGDSQGGPTFFDLATALALVHFAERHVDVAVLEVGLGGRLDSTNVCLPVVSVVTSISRDHTKQLGNTLASIAREKAGILKPGVPVVSGVTDTEPRGVIESTAHERGCRLIQAGRDFRFRYRPPQACRDGETRRQGDKEIATVPSGTLDFECATNGLEQRLDDVSLAMHGRHQAANAATALAVIAELRHQGWGISTDAMRVGLAQAALPARVEYFPGEPAVVLDAAHNEASVRALLDTIAEWPAPSRRTLIVSVSRDKDVAAIIRQIAPAFDRFLVTQYQENPRAVPVAQLAGLLRDACAKLRPPGETAPPEVIESATPMEAWQIARSSALLGELVTITGSFFLAAEMRPLVVARDHGVTGA